uniref:Uncharacterized protein n=1 Tax=Sphaerodactylus townsendi TaxID=933632 RepID=A0ACB8EUY7_9SAUR
MESKRKASAGGSGGGEPTPSQRKKPRGGDWEDDGPSQFEEELAFLDEMEAEMALEAKEAQGTSDAVPLGNLISSVRNPKWQRPPLPKMNPKEDALCFQQVDLDYYVDMYGYHGQHLLPYLKIANGAARLIAPAKRLLEQGLRCGALGTHNYQAFESNIDFEIRFMVDQDMRRLQLD